MFYRTVLSTSARKSSLLAASLAVLAVSGFSYTLRAEDPKMGDHKMNDQKMAPMSAEDQKMMADAMTKCKTEMTDPANAEMMKKEMAAMMVMDEMAKSMASDPKCKEMCTQMMNDPKVKAMHEEAMKMANDPTQKKSMKEAIMNDPKMMRIVMHQSMMMSMMHDNMMGDAKMGEKMAPN